MHSVSSQTMTFTEIINKISNLENELQELIDSEGRKAFIPENIVDDIKMRTNEKSPGKPPYQGPYRVVERSDKFFTLSMKEKNVNISIDRLKPAYLLVTDKDDKPTQAKQTDGNSDHRDSHLPSDTQTTSRCGRKIKQPVRFRD
ncbi:hypothetical protein HNY73_007335 [Argiope bruennichi]|uniref:Uncharacterized protein n=1 Tax=Argiope bruennichi TaxID=94029 RepID=A0A8T0FG68_ARGBR|nr:hypothetical protein HNY73_007335 [Argiope bruennichi]